MALTLYRAEGTWLHRLHPITKLAGLLAVIVAAFLVDRPLVQLPLLAGAVLLLVPARALPNVWRLRLMFLLVTVFTVLIWTFFFQTGPVPGGPPPPPRGVPTYAGFLFGLSTAIRLDTFLAIGTVFLTTTRVEEVAYALARLGVPYQAGFTLTLAFRLVPVFFDAALSVVQAQRCRGLEFSRGGLVTRLRRYVPVIVPVLIGALRRADRMAMALELRGFNSGRPRTTYLRARAGPADLVAGGVVLATVVAYVVVWKLGRGTLGAP